MSATLFFPAKAPEPEEEESEEEDDEEEDEEEEEEGRYVWVVHIYFSTSTLINSLAPGRCGCNHELVIF